MEQEVCGILWACANAYSAPRERDDSRGIYSKKSHFALGSFPLQIPFQELGEFEFRRTR